jgi:UDP-N-acetylmuramate--alanine ligase
MHAGTLEDGVEAVLSAAAPGDMILTLGAGSVSQAGEVLLRRLEERA